MSDRRETSPEPRETQDGMVRLLRHHDWSATPLGSPREWPPRLQHLIELILASPLPTFVLAGADRILIYNAVFGDLCGAPHPGAFGRPLGETMPAVLAALDAALAEVESGKAMIENIAWPAGETRLALTPVRDAQGAVAWVQGQIVGQPTGDSGGESLRLALEVGRVATWDWDIEANAVGWSDEHFRIEGYEVGEVTPSYEAWAQRLHPEDRADTEATLLAARDNRGAYEHEFRIVRPDGEVRWVAALGRFYYDRDGRPLRMIGVMRDVTGRRRAAETQQLLIAELQHRTRNLIGIVRSLTRKTLNRSQSLEDFYERFGLRLAAGAGAEPAFAD